MKTSERRHKTVSEPLDLCRALALGVQALRAAARKSRASGAGEAFGLLEAVAIQEGSTVADAIFANTADLMEDASVLVVRLNNENEKLRESLTLATQPRTPTQGSPTVATPRPGLPAACTSRCRPQVHYGGEAKTFAATAADLERHVAHFFQGNGLAKGGVS